MTRPGIDVERMGRDAVERTLARSRVRLDRQGAIYRDMVKENADLIRKALRAAARIAANDTDAPLREDGVYHEGRLDAATAIRHAARTRKGK